MNDGILCQLTLQCGAVPKVEHHDCWGLIDGDQFVLIPREQQGSMGRVRQ
jgi:hypothetical protein